MTMRHKVTCTGCDRFMFWAIGTIKLEGYICPSNKCKAIQNVNLTLALEQPITEPERKSKLETAK